MKTIHASLLILFLATALTHGDEIIDSKVAAKIKTYTPAEFADKANTLTNQIIRIKFNLRGKIEASEEKAGYRISSVGIYEPNSSRNKQRSGNFNVLFPESALPWFTHIPYDGKTAPMLTAIVRVRAATSDFYGDPFVEIIGRNLKTDHKGTQAVW